MNDNENIKIDNNSFKSLLKPSFAFFGYHIGCVILCEIFNIGLSSLYKTPLGMVGLAIILLIVYSLPIYNYMWGLGHRDRNKQSFGHMEKDNFRGFKIGLIGLTPIFIAAILFIVSRFGVFYNFTMIFQLINSPIKPLMRLISNSTFVAEYSYLQVFSVALLTVIPAIIAGIAYIIGSKDFSISQYLMYKKDKE